MKHMCAFKKVLNHPPLNLLYLYDIYLQIHKHMKGYELSKGWRVRVDKKGDVCLPYDVPTLHYSNP